MFPTVVEPPASCQNVSITSTINVSRYKYAMQSQKPNQEIRQIPPSSFLIRSQTRPLFGSDAVVVGSENSPS